MINRFQSKASHNNVDLMLAQYDLEAGNEQQINASLQYIKAFQGENERLYTISAISPRWQDLWRGYV